MYLFSFAPRLTSIWMAFASNDGKNCSSIWIRISSSHAILSYYAIVGFGPFDQQKIKNSLLDEDDIPKLSPESSLSILNVTEKIIKSVSSFVY